MNNVDNQAFFLKDWRVSPSEGQLKKGKTIIHLEPKSMDMLVYFASRAGEVISRDEFEREVWHNTIIGYDAITGTVIKLRKALNDNAKNPEYIATVPKRGYQLIAPIHYSDEKIPIPSKPPHIVQKKSLHHLGLLSLILVGLFTIWLFLSQFDAPQEEKTNQLAIELKKPITSNKLIPTIAILPFDNLSENQENDYLAIGISEDIITDISRIHNFQVISSHASAQFKGSKMSTQQIGEALKADYILRGNIRTFANMIRVNIQVIDSKTGINRWAQSYDRKQEDVFAIQSEVTLAIIEEFDIRLSKPEQQRLSHQTTNSLLAYDYFQQGQRASKLQTKEGTNQALNLYRKAIAADANYGRAYGAMGYLLAYQFRRGWTESPLQTIEQALELSKKAVALDKSIPQTYWSLGYVYMMRREFEKAKIATTKAIEIAPSYADAYALLGLIYNNMGMGTKALEQVNKGIALNPYYTWDYLYNQGRAHYSLGNYKQAVALLEKAKERNENAIPIKLFLAASYIGAEQVEDAQWEIEQILVLNPNETITHTTQSIPIRNKPLMAQFIHDLKLAGLPQ